MLLLRTLSFQSHKKSFVIAVVVYTLYTLLAVERPIVALNTNCRLLLVAAPRDTWRRRSRLTTLTQKQEVPTATKLPPPLSCPPQVERLQWNAKKTCHTSPHF